MESKRLQTKFYLLMLMNVVNTNYFMVRGEHYVHLVFPSSSLLLTFFILYKYLMYAYMDGFTPHLVNPWLNE